jgi:predicted DNA-binding protein
MDMMILEAIDEQVETMSQYPDAEAMLERLKKDYL